MRTDGSRPFVMTRKERKENIRNIAIFFMAVMFSTALAYIFFRGSALDSEACDYLKRFWGCETPMNESSDQMVEIDICSTGALPKCNDTALENAKSFKSSLNQKGQVFVNTKHLEGTAVIFGVLAFFATLFVSWCCQPCRERRFVSTGRALFVCDDQGYQQASGREARFQDEYQQYGH